MKLRKLLLWSLVLAGVGLTACGNTATEEKPATAEAQEQTIEKDALEGTVGEIKKGTFTTDVDMSKYDKGKVVRLWVPIPQTNGYQTIENFNYDLDDTHAKAEVAKDEHGNEALYVEWDKEAADRKVTITYDAGRAERLRPELVEKQGEAKEDLSPYLSASSMMPIDGEVKELADKITEGKTTQIDKAKAIYDWTVANMERDDSVIGCGLGNVPELLEVSKGKCTDIHSVYTALNRAAGIPTREIFGIRMSKDKEADVTKSQHCWTEFYLEGTGWVAADPADVLKAVLTNKWDKEQNETKELQDYFWGNLDNIRVGLAQVRDITLNPKQAGDPLNNFGYPYAEVDDKPVDCYQPDEFIYKINYKDIAE
ncbi:MAG: transglutaminase-like domain-containing protein [Gallicola sp.]|nr:transglutaminase-like domain-containing protein [Gallicola sp.]